MQEGEIIEWKKQEGDVWLMRRYLLLEIMSDKTNMETPEADSGVLLKITVRLVKLKSQLLKLSVAAGAEGEAWPTAQASAPAAEPTPKEVAASRACSSSKRKHLSFTKVAACNT